jgi:hypothetical protein
VPTVAEDAEAQIAGMEQRQARRTNRTERFDLFDHVDLLLFDQNYAAAVSLG